jgi:hypothetical protein
MSNLRLINETTASSVSSVSITDVFSADFDIYKITAVGDFTNGNQVVNSRFINSSGSVVSTSNYDYAILSMESSSSFNQDRSTNNSFMRRMVYSHNGNDFGFTLYIFNPYSSSSYSFGLWQGEGVPTGGGTGAKGIGVLKQTASMTGIQFYNVDFTDISVKCYGLRVDS